MKIAPVTIEKAWTDPNDSNRIQYIVIDHDGVESNFVTPRGSGLGKILSREIGNAKYKAGSRQRVNPPVPCDGDAIPTEVKFQSEGEGEYREKWQQNYESLTGKESSL